MNRMTLKLELIACYIDQHNCMENRDMYMYTLYMQYFIYTFDVINLIENACALKFILNFAVGSFQQTVQSIQSFLSSPKIGDRVMYFNDDNPQWFHV